MNNKWLKTKLRKWLFPEYNAVCDFMTEMDKAARELIGDGKDIKIKGHIVLVGSLNKCKVEITHTLKPRIVLAELTMGASLSVIGKQHVVTQSTFLGGNALSVESEEKDE